MNDSLRWLLVLGCLCIVFLEAPQDLLQVLQDSSGAYPARGASALVDASRETPSPHRVTSAADPAPWIDAAPSPSVAVTVLDVPGSTAPSTRAPANRRSEEDRAHEQRDDRTEFRAEFATGR